MSRAEIEHKGMTIFWSDNEDKWSCSELGFSSQSLIAVKRKIDTFRKKERSGIAVPALYVGHSYAVPCEIVEYIGERKTYTRQGELAPKVAVMRPSSRHADRKTRQEDWLHELAPATPEVEATLAKVAEMEAAADQLKRDAIALTRSIPRLKIEDIAELVAHKLQDAGEDAE
jgi:hypothetical protein